MSRPAAIFAQLSGMNLFTLASMILQLVKTFHSNNEEYLQLEQCVQMLRGLLQILPETETMMQHQAVREVMKGLEDTLREAYMLLRSFRDSSVSYRIFMGWKQAGHLRQVQKKIDMYLHLYHVVRDVDTNRLLRSIADSIQGTPAMQAAAAGTAIAIANGAGVHLDTPSDSSDDDDDIVAIASPQPGPQQPALPS